MPAFKKHPFAKFKTERMKRYVAGKLGAKTVVVKAGLAEEYSTKMFEPRESILKKRNAKISNPRFHSTLHRIGLTHYFSNLTSFPGQIVVPEQSLTPTLHLPGSFASSIADTQSAKWVGSRNEIEKTGGKSESLIDFPQTGMVTVDSSLVYDPTEIRLTNGNSPVPVLFQRSRYLDQAADIWKLGAIAGYESFKRHLDKFQSVIDEHFILDLFSDSESVIYANSDNTIFFDVFQAKFEEKYGELKKLTISESLNYLTVDEIEQLIEKTIYKKLG